MCLAMRQAYVALSRLRSLEGLELTGPLRRGAIRAHPAVKAFYQQMGVRADTNDTAGNGGLRIQQPKHQHMQSSDGASCS